MRLRPGLRVHRLLALALLGGATPLPVRAQSIVGKVLDHNTNTPIVAGDVHLVDRTGLVRARSIADTAGWFRLVAPIPGTYRLRAASLGYSAVESIELALDKGVEIETEVRLSSQAITLEPLRIIGRREVKVGRLAEYYDRAEWTRKSGFGRVFMRDDIERMSPFSVTSLLRTVPARTDCPMTYMLDGLIVEARMIDSMIQPEDVEGIEIYRGYAQVPAEYSFRASCALTLIWTRNDPPGMKPFTWKRVLLGLAAAGVLFGLATAFSPR